MKEINEKLAAILKAKVEKEKYVDVSAGVEKLLYVSRERLNNAVKELQKQGYYVATCIMKKSKPRIVMKVLTDHVITGEEFVQNYHKMVHNHLRLTNEDVRNLGMLTSDYRRKMNDILESQREKHA